MVIFLHFFILQVLWWGSILSAVHLDFAPWAPFFMVIILLLLSHFTSLYNEKDRILGVVATLIGLVLDTLWIQLGLIEYTADWPIAGFCPLWILVLWFGVGFDFRHSLLWLEQRKIIGGIVTGISAPLCYWSAMKAGVGQIPNEMQFITPLVIGITWAIVFPAYAQLAVYIERIPDISFKRANNET